MLNSQRDLTFSLNYLFYLYEFCIFGYHSAMFIRKDVFFRVSKNTSSLTFFNNVLLIVVILTVILYIYVSSCSSVNITFFFVSFVSVFRVKRQRIGIIG